MNMIDRKTSLYREVITDFSIRINKEQVFQAAGGRKEDSAFFCLEEAFLEAEERFYKLIAPRVILKEQKDPEGAVLVFMTLGQKISDWISRCFQDGKYMQGLVLDILSDLYLFEADRAAQQQIKEFCAVRRLGVEKREEAPKDFSFEAQKKLVNSMLEEKDGIFVTEGGMLSPVKSMFYVCRLTEKAEVFQAQHDCGKCPAKNCRMRRNQAEEENRFQIVSKWEELPVNRADGEFAAGLKAGEEQVKSNEESGRKKKNEAPAKKISASAYVIAVDIGTTTIVVNLTETASEKILAQYSAVNPQRKYGIDVISRIQSAQGGKAGLLRELVQTELLKGIMHCSRGLRGKEGLIKQIGIAGNTAMVQLLLGISCEGLTKYPFYIEKKGELRLPFAQVFGEQKEWEHVEVVILPAIAPFIGGDITAGLLKCGFAQKKKPSLFLDLGTNGEMVIGGRGNYLCASTAAGPAFEGGNISHGTGSIMGAVCGVEIKGRIPRIQTVGNQLPVGICGTGVVEMAAELLKKGLLKTDGLLEERYFSSGFPYGKLKSGETLAFMQSDVRELQLAKGAFAAGIELLLERFGVSAEEVEEVYLAGGFGYHMKVDKAFRIGLLPKGLEGKVKSAGNTSLGGAAAYLLQNGAEEAVSDFCNFSREIILAKEPGFSEKYMERMAFPI